MNKVRAKDMDSANTADSPIRKLLAANAVVQADATKQSGSEPHSETGYKLLDAIINQIPDHIYVKDTQGRFLVANEAVARDNALERVEDLIGRTDFDLFPADVAQRVFDIEQAIMSTGEPMIDVEEERLGGNGSSRWILTSKVPLRDDNGAVVGLVGTARDITARKTAELRLEAERTLYRAMIDEVPDYLFVKDTQNRFVVANHPVAADLGLLPADLIGKTDFDLHRPDLAHKFYADEQKIMRTGEPLIGIEEPVLDFEGKEKWFSSSKVPMRDDQGRITGLVGVCRDITDRKRAQEQVHFMALHDALTGLPNRTLLMDRLTHGILKAERTGDRLTVMFIDLDNFKLINDSMGHNAGDTLLKAASDRMVASVRSTDTVARLGGDEFVILLVDQATSAVEPISILKKLQDAIAAPMLIDGQQCQVTSSIGVARYPENGADAESLLMNADMAMYEAKDNGRDNFQFYTDGMNDAARERRLLQDGLRRAIANNEFSLVYQPQVDIKTRRIFAVEALARWNHPALGEVPPTKFIPLAEESGLIVPIGDWVLREACRQNKAWQDGGIDPITVCVNVSARQFREPDWVKRVGDILIETGLEPRYLELELTESMLMRDVQQAVATMEALQSLGVNFAIDDFGTGYSSLSALKDFPVARLKIDQSFVRGLPNDANEQKIATAVISLGQKLNMRVIAEGVETDEQLAFLRDNHCDEIQGYHFSEPVRPDLLARMLGGQRSRPGG